jgi:hypothetical protein
LQSFVPNTGTKGFPLLSGLKHPIKFFTENLKDKT